MIVGLVSSPCALIAIEVDVDDTAVGVGVSSASAKEPVPRVEVAKDFLEEEDHVGGRHLRGLKGGKTPTKAPTKAPTSTTVGVLLYATNALTTVPPGTYVSFKDGTNAAQQTAFIPYDLDLTFTDTKWTCASLVAGKCTLDGRGLNGLILTRGSTTKFFIAFFTIKNSSGSAIHIAAGDLNAISSCSFVLNKSSEKGGAIFVDASCSVQLKQVTFANNQALQGGALFVTEFSFVSVVGCFFSNKAPGTDDIFNEAISPAGVFCSSQTDPLLYFGPGFLDSSCPTTAIATPAPTSRPPKKTKKGSA